MIKIPFKIKTCCLCTIGDHDLAGTTESIPKSRELLAINGIILNYLVCPLHILHSTYDLVCWPLLAFISLSCFVAFGGLCWFVGLY
jgi:hypothetical protein